MHTDKVIPLSEVVGKQAGFLISHAVFTTIFYFILLSTNKLPISWGFLHILMITSSIILFGLLFRRYLDN